MLCPSDLHACSLPGDCASVTAALKRRMLRKPHMHISRQGLSLLGGCPPSSDDAAWVQMITCWKCQCTFHKAGQPLEAVSFQLHCDS